jgi:hypothetical protein
VGIEVHLLEFVQTELQATSKRAGGSSFLLTFCYSIRQRMLGVKASENPLLPFPKFLSQIAERCLVIDKLSG